MHGQHFSSRVSKTVERISKCCLTSLAERRGTGKAEEPRAEAAGLGFLVAVGLLPELAEPEVGAQGLVVAEHHLPVASREDAPPTRLWGASEALGKRI